MPSSYFVRAARVGREDLLVRAPELAPLREKTVALFGLGCLGSTCALELARAGIGRLRLLDHDYVDPATAIRWPLGFSAAGELKVEALKAFVDANYPWTEVDSIPHWIGFARLDGCPPPGLTDAAALDRMMRDAAIVLDATAETGIQHFLSRVAAARGLPYVGLSGTSGGWGGKIFRFWPDHPQPACWNCYRLALNDGTIPPPPSRPEDDVQSVGCADLTFTGASFDMQTVAMTAVRCAVSTLCAGVEGGYPALPWDVMTVALRDAAGRPIEPEFKGYVLERHPSCASCNGT